MVRDIGNFVRRLKAVEETKPLGKNAEGWPHVLDFAKRSHLGVGLG